MLITLFIAVFGFVGGAGIYIYFLGIDVFIKEKTLEFIVFGVFGTILAFGLLFIGTFMYLAICYFPSRLFYKQKTTYATRLKRRDQKIDRLQKAIDSYRSSDIYVSYDWNDPVCISDSGPDAIGFCRREFRLIIQNLSPNVPMHSVKAYLEDVYPYVLDSGRAQLRLLSDDSQDGSQSRNGITLTSGKEYVRLVASYHEKDKLPDRHEILCVGNTRTIETFTKQTLFVRVEGIVNGEVHQRTELFALFYDRSGASLLSCENDYTSIHRSIFETPAVQHQKEDQA